MLWRPGETRATRVGALDCKVTDGVWAFARDYARDIDAHWERRQAENPVFFNGPIHILCDYALDGVRGLSARFLRTDFKSFLYWRETGWPDTRVMDGFGSGLILSAEGHALLARQRAGNLNTGLAYPPGGFIDPSDIDAAGRIDLVRSVRREVAEETGLDTDQMRRTDGFLVAVAGPLLSVTVGWQSDFDTEALLTRARRHIAGERESELADVAALAPGAPAPAELRLPEHVRVLFDFLASSKSGR